MSPRFHLLPAPQPGDPSWYTNHTVPEQLRDHVKGGAAYQPGPALVTACNVALALGSPLLVTGDPGTGKTQLAWWLAQQLGARTLRREERGTRTPLDAIDDAWTQPFMLSVKSTTTWRDLLYQFDTVRYFHDGQPHAHRRADLRTLDYVTPGPLWRAIRAAMVNLPSVVLIDEIDKAPRDFPNDLLHELDQFSFHVPEVTDDPEIAQGVRRPEGKAPPLVVITSNNERRLPDAFLRRCVFHHIELTRELVQAAVEARSSAFPNLDPEVIHKAIGLLLLLADPEARTLSLSRRPGTAELLAWLTVLDRLYGRSAKLAGPIDKLPAIGVLIKDRDDHEELKRHRV